MSSNIDYEELEIKIFKEHNALRKNPQSYIKKLENSLNFYSSNILAKENETPIPTYEGVKAVKDAINFLKSQQPVKELIYNKELCLSCKDLVNDIGPKGLISHEGTEIKSLYNRLEQYCEWDGAISENLDFGFKIPENIIMNMLIDDGDENRYQRMNLFFPDFKYMGVAVGPHRDYEICVVIEYAYNIREKGTQYINVDNLIRKLVKLKTENKNGNKEYEYNSIYEDNKKGGNNLFQEGDPDAPDNTVSLRVEKEEKLVDGQIMKVTKKIFTLDDNSQHIVEIDEPQEPVNP